jgi:hypothetical protein
MDHIFQRYFAKHGHYPRVVVNNGSQRLTVELNAGYLSISTSSPYQAKVYITRSAFFALMRKLTPLARRWEPHEDFDVPKAMHEAYLFEKSMVQEKRLTKKDPSKAARQRQRWLAAKVRGQQRTE